MLTCCLIGASRLPVDASLVASLCLSIALSAYVETLRDGARQRGSEVASLAFVATSIFVPALVPFAPPALYDAARGFDRESPSPLLGRAALFMVALTAHLCSGNLSAETIMLSAVFAFTATLLSVRTTQVEREHARNATVRDDLQERTLLLEGKPADSVDFSTGVEEAGSHERADAFATLTDREFEVVRLIAEGLDNKEIAATAYMGEGTVRNHISSILAKLSLRNRTQIAIAHLKA